MPTSPQQIHTDYPLAVYNYRVEIGDTAVAFSDISGLNIAYETHTFKESQTGGLAGPRVYNMPAQRAAVKLTLKKGVVPKTSLPALYEWIQTVQVNNVQKKDVTIRLCDEKGLPLITWVASNAFPTKLEAPHFDAKSNDAALDSMELTADFVTVAVE